MNPKYRMKCVGKTVWETVNGFSRMTSQIAGCGWVGIRTDHIECECYDINAHYCRPLTPGPGCPSGIVWPCPRCGGAVTGKPVQHRVKVEP